MESQIKLSDGEKCTVRALGLFELDDVALEKAPGPFYEEIVTAGKNTIRTLYKPPAEPPEMPEFSRDGLRKGSQGWQLWLEYDLYQAFLDHRREEKRIMSKYAEDVKDYILSNCLSPEDRFRAVTLKDWEKVNEAAFGALLKEEDIAEVLRTNFQG